jgi:hypothetical protein
MMACHIQKTDGDKVSLSRLMRHQRWIRYVLAVARNVNHLTRRGKEVSWLTVFNLISTSLFDEARLDYSFLAASDGLYELPWLDTSSPLQAQEWWLQNHSQEILPPVPREQNHRADLTTPNPFAEDSVDRHSSIRSSAIKPLQRVVNSYVKVQFWNLDGTAVTVVAPKYSTFYPNAMAVHHRSLPYMPGSAADIPRLPPDFGRELKLDQLDSKLFKFCEHLANVSVARKSSLLT